MKFKRSYILFGLVLTLFVFANYTIYKASGAHPGSTGAPGELTCAQSGCHADAMVTKDSVSAVNTLVFSASDTLYAPGQTYTLTLRVNNPGKVKFGFELNALKDSTNTNIGSLSVLDQVRTQKISHVAGTDFRYSMTHKTAGNFTTTPGAIEWKMLWTAPDYNVGTITFYYATNNTNNNGQNTGDHIYLSKFKIRPFVFVNPFLGIGDISNTTDLSVHFDASSHHLKLRFTYTESSQAKIQVLDMGGKLIVESAVKPSVLEQEQDVLLPEDCATGTYFVKLLTNKGVATKKVVVQ